MKNIILFGFSLILISCSNSGIYRELIQALDLVFTSPKDLPQEAFAEIPYSTIQVRLGRSDNTVLVLEEINDNSYKWTSSNLIKIYTENRIITKVSGLEVDIDSIKYDDNHPSITKNYKNIDSEIYTSEYNFKNPNLFNLPIKTKFTFLKMDEVSIFGKDIKCMLFAEESLENLIRWEFKNFYWVDLESNEIIKIIQNVNPKLPEIHIKMINIMD